MGAFMMKKKTPSDPVVQPIAPKKEVQKTDDVKPPMDTIKGLGNLQIIKEAEEADLELEAFTLRSAQSDKPLGSVGNPSGKRPTKF